MQIDMRGKTVLITGAAGGIGAAAAAVFRAAGAQLVLTDLHVESLPQGTDICARACDVTQKPEVEAVVQAGLDTFGKIDIAINNAGISGPWGRFTDLKAAAWDQLLAVNLTGLVHALQAEIAAMTGARDPGTRVTEGRILNVASLAGVSGAPGLAGYAATKHGVVGLTKSLAHELGRDNIRVNALCPSFIDTPMLDAMGGDKDRLHSPLNATRRFGTAQEMADALLWMAAPQNSFMNGQTVTLDGGISAL